MLKIQSEAEEARPTSAGGHDTSENTEQAPGRAPRTNQDPATGLATLEQNRRAVDRLGRSTDCSV